MAGIEAQGPVVGCGLPLGGAEPWVRQLALGRGVPAVGLGAVPRSADSVGHWGGPPECLCPEGGDLHGASDSSLPPPTSMLLRVPAVHDSDCTYATVYWLLPSCLSLSLYKVF